MHIISKAIMPTAKQDANSSWLQCGASLHTKDILHVALGTCFVHTYDANRTRTTAAATLYELASL
jgi:hypothetical protein